MHHLISISGGKDSTALLLYAIEKQIEPMTVCFADTGHEHQQTYDYVRELERLTGTPIKWVRANFKAQMAVRRENIQAKWSASGVPQARIDRALEMLVPTGNPFLDMCMLKGRFPSSMARFCTQELKHKPIDDVVMKLLQHDDAVMSWQGVRAQESRSRAKLQMWEITDPWPRLWIYRPLLHWTHEEVFAMHRRHGIPWNPLYEQGMGRVGCMPCIMASKPELREIAKRFPEEVERVAAWERIVAEVSKRGLSSFFASDKTPGDHVGRSDQAAPGIHEVMDWALTSRGGRQYDLISVSESQSEDAPTCASVYGLCE